MRSSVYSARRVTSPSLVSRFAQLTSLTISALVCAAFALGSTAHAESRVQLKVTLGALKVSATKANGKPWDARVPLRKGSELPDLTIEVKRGVEVLLTTTVRKNTLTATYANDRFFFWSGDVITVNVWDRDLAKPDLIGSFLIRGERGKTDLKGDQVESLQMIKDNF